MSDTKKEEVKVEENKKEETKTTETKPKDEGKTFTQEEVSKMMAREKQQGRVSAYNALGIDASDEAKVEKIKNLINAIYDDTSNVVEDELPTEFKQIVNGYKTEAQKAKENLTKMEAKYHAATSGVASEYIDDVIELASMKVTEDTPLPKVIESMKKTHSFYFTEPKSSQQSSGTGTNVGRNQQSVGKKDEENFGKLMARMNKNM